MNSPPAARGSQEAGFTQPKAHLLADPCKYLGLEKRHVGWMNLESGLHGQLTYSMALERERVNSSFTDLHVSILQIYSSSFRQLVPLCDLPPRRGDHLVPMMESRPRAGGPSELESANHLKQTAERITTGSSRYNRHHRWSRRKRARRRGRQRQRGRYSESEQVVRN